MTEPKMKFLDFSNNQSYGLPESKISLTTDGKAMNRITLNAKMTEIVRNGFMYLRVGYSDFSQEMNFIFCKKSSPDALVVTPGKKAKTVINSKFLVEQMIAKMGLAVRNQHLNVSENIANSEEFYNFRITKE